MHNTGRADQYVLMNCALYGTNMIRLMTLSVHYRRADQQVLMNCELYGTNMIRLMTLSVHYMGRADQQVLMNCPVLMKKKCERKDGAIRAFHHVERH